MTKWKLTDEEYEFIKGEVIHLFEHYKIKCIPVCGFEIATKMSIPIKISHTQSRFRLFIRCVLSDTGLESRESR